MSNWNDMFSLFKKGGKTIRFHTDYMVDRQDVAQHSFQCALMAAEIADAVNKAAGVELCDPYKLSHYMLLHDLPEEYGGDIPGHIKRDFPKIREGFEELEANWVKTRLSRFSQNAWKNLNETEQVIFSFVDCYDCAQTALNECRLGNHEDMAYICDVCYNVCLNISLNNHGFLGNVLFEVQADLFDKIKENKNIANEIEKLYRSYS